MKLKYTVMDFDPGEGIALYGVFDTHDEALTWAKQYKKPYYVVGIYDHQETSELIQELNGGLIK